MFKSDTINNYIKTHSYDVDFSYKKDSSIAIIVETRPIENLEWTITNIYYHTNFNIKLFCSNDNIDLIKHLPIDISIIDNIDVNGYNQMLTSYDFWNNIEEENVLIFQTDSFIINSDITKLFKFDFIGADWSWTKNKYTEFAKGSNGGLSFRHKSKMIEIIKKFKYDGKMNEDMYFGYYLNKIESIIPLPETKQLFCCESIYNGKTYAIHACDKYLSEETIKEILK